MALNVLKCENMCEKIWWSHGKCLNLPLQHSNYYDMEQEQIVQELGKSREEVGRELIKWRIRAGLTQNEVAHRWGMSRYSIIRAEKGKPVSWKFTYNIMARLAQEVRKEAGYE